MIYAEGSITLNGKNHAVAIRDFDASDIDALVEYWYRSSVEYFASIQIDILKFRKTSEEDFRQRIVDYRAESNAKGKPPATIVIDLDGKAIGCHSLTDISADSAIMHAHIFRPEYRRVGIGSFSYPRAASAFMNLFNLQKIVFKTPLNNIGAQVVKERMGILPLREEPLVMPILFEGTMAKVYELTRDHAMNIIEEQDRVLARSPSNHKSAE